jgi:low affinity Fe/Cu permease
MRANGEHMNEIFRRTASRVSALAGSATAFLAAVAIVAIWGVSGPIFHFSDTWQLVINTATTIVTFLMVFLIQNTQNRDSLAIHTKLDELLVATQGARNSIAIAEELSDEQLGEEMARFKEVATKAEETTAEVAARERGTRVSAGAARANVTGTTQRTGPAPDRQTAERISRS